MPSTLTPTCPSCGLRFASRPLLELHVREDHLRRGDRAGHGRGEPPGSRTSWPPAAGPARQHGQPSRPAQTADEGNAMTAIRPQRRLRSGWAMAALRRVIRTLHRDAAPPTARRGQHLPPRQPQDQEAAGEEPATDRLTTRKERPPCARSA